MVAMAIVVVELVGDDDGGACNLLQINANTSVTLGATYDLHTL